MRYVLIENGAVTNATIFDGEKPDEWDKSNAWIASEEAQIGWTYVDGKFVEPPRVEQPEPEPIVLTKISKNLIWERATDAEAEQMDAALKAQPIRIRRIYDGATFISTEDELYGLLNAAMVQMFGETRAKELLEPNA